MLPRTFRRALICVAISQAFVPLFVSAQTAFEYRKAVPTLSADSPIPLISLSAASLDMGSVFVGSAAPQKTVLLSNTSKVPLVFSSPPVVSGSGFSSSTNCNAPIAGGENCQVNVFFTPVAAGTATASLAYTSNATSSPSSVALTGYGLLTAVSAPSATVDFGTQLVGTTSSATGVILSNTGNTPVTVTGVTTAGAFAATHNCPGSLSVGSTCNANVTFTPSTMGAATGALSFATGAGTKVVSLAGIGLKAVALAAPTSLTLAATSKGATSAAQSVSLSNTGNTAMTVTSLSASAPFNVASTTCGATVSAGSACSVNITFSPTAVGAATGNLTLATSGSAAPLTVGLSGTGNGTSLGSATLSQSFGTVVTGSTANLTYTVTNSGNQPATLAFGSLATGVVRSGTCNTTLAAGSSCSVVLAYTPTSATAVSGGLTVSAADSSVTLSYAGMGALPASATFVYSGAIDTSFVAPKTGTYSIEVFGAGGGARTNYGGASSGAYLKCAVSITAGTSFKILVGGVGASTTTTAGAGGGTFVTTSTNAPLAVAGGGGGGILYSGGGAGTVANNGTTTGGTGSSPGAGLTGNSATAKSFTNGGASGGYGGFGGGGGPSGGGGGYNGGNFVPTSQSYGTGGGSYCSGTLVTGTDGSNAGDGKVIITY